MKDMIKLIKLVRLIEENLFFFIYLIVENIYYYGYNSFEGDY